jgi:ATP-dependent Clp protease ATP-binding subunit ClpC
MDDLVRLWDVSHLTGAAASAPEIMAAEPVATLSPELAVLPKACARLLRLGIGAPLSLIRDLLTLTGGRATGQCEALRHDLRHLMELRWPEQARIGLVALLLHQVKQPDWRPPADSTPSQVGEAIGQALAGSEVPSQAPTPPIALLRQAAAEIDERLLSILQILGPGVVAAEPGLPLRLLAKAGSMPRLNRRQRQLLGIRVHADGNTGQATGIAAGADRAIAGGIEMGPLSARRRSLLPSQLAMPSNALLARHLRGELLFRSREASEPPQLRPTVILLDVSPPTFGPVESVTRLAAHIVTSTLQATGVPAVLLTPDDPIDAIVTIERRADLVELWTRRTLSPANPARLLKVANAIRLTLQDERGLEPVVLLLSHCWFGAEDKLAEKRSYLRGLFVHHPNSAAAPVAASWCAQHRCISPGETASLSRILGELLA